MDKPQNKKITYRKGTGRLFLEWEKRCGSENLEETETETRNHENHNHETKILIQHRIDSESLQVRFRRQSPFLVTIRGIGKKIF